MDSVDKRLQPTSGFLALLQIGVQVVNVSVIGVCESGRAVESILLKIGCCAKILEHVVVLSKIYKTEEIHDDGCTAEVVCLNVAQNFAIVEMPCHLKKRQLITYFL